MTLNCEEWNALLNLASLVMNLKLATQRNLSETVAISHLCKRNLISQHPSPVIEEEKEMTRYTMEDRQRRRSCGGHYRNFVMM